MSAERLGQLDVLISAHLRWMAAAGYAEATTRARRRHLERFAAWAAPRGITHGREITLPVLERYREALFPRGSKSAQAQALSALKQWLGWAARMRHLGANPAAELQIPRLGRRLPASVLTHEEAERVLARPDTTTPTGLRDRAILEVLYSTGIRRAELIALTLADLDASGGALRIRRGKGDKERIVPIGRRALTWVDDYLCHARPRLLRAPDRGVLFLTRRGTALRANRLTERMHRYVLEAGIPKGGACHVFRHTAATLMLDGGADIRAVQEILGHAELSTTQIYTHVSIRRLKEVHAKTHPAEAPAPPLPTT
ncbi:MAG TPA: tyrosine-type recombinase/integrase [Longimicrobiaceae bacterium]|nr:tyrosine-type recombinase/integrase [Longimicrobiaceae bacterium]